MHHRSATNRALSSLVVLTSLDVDVSLCSVPRADAKAVAFCTGTSCPELCVSAGCPGGTGGAAVAKALWYSKPWYSSGRCNVDPGEGKTLSKIGWLEKRSNPPND